MINRLCATLALGALALPAGPVQAAGTNVMQLAGTGTVSPGLGAPFCTNESVTFSATMVMEGTHAGTYALNFNGNTTACDINENGSGTLSGSVTGHLTYTRTSAHLGLSGVISLGGDSMDFGASCAYVPTSVNPTTSFALACVASTLTANATAHA